MHPLMRSEDEAVAAALELVQAVAGRAAVDVGVAAFAHDPDSDSLVRRVERLAARRRPGGPLLPVRPLPATEPGLDRQRRRRQA